MKYQEVMTALLATLMGTTHCLPLQTLIQDILRLKVHTSAMNIADTSISQPTGKIWHTGKILQSGVLWERGVQWQRLWVQRDATMIGLGLIWIWGRR